MQWKVQFKNAFMEHLLAFRVCLDLRKLSGKKKIGKVNFFPLFGAEKKRKKKI